MSAIDERASTRLPLAVALSGSQEASLRVEAEACAERWHLPLLVRPPKAPLRGLLARARTLLVFGQDGVSLWDSQGHVRGGPGLAALRIARIEKGREEDPLQRIGGLRPGESVLDATLGFGQDARVAARLVGPQGKVVGVEASLPLAILAEASLRRERRPGSAPVEVEQGDSMALLQVSAAGAFDVILFDPMFGRALASQPGFVVLRRYADPRPLTSEALSQAQRVARRLVLVKTARYTSALRSLGLRPERAARSAPVVWARVPTRPPS
jgi:16S rRNA (guanine1516-N2)-methyltransferase